MGIWRQRSLRLMVLAAFLGAGSVPVGAQQLPDYTVNPGDNLDVDVYKEVELTKTVVVRPDGKFSFPLAGDILAVGRTVVQIQQELSNKLTRYIPEPVVTVAVKTLDGCKIYVIGQVLHPGAFVMNPRVNALQALSMAGGMTPFAATNDIVILRGQGNNQKSVPFRYGDVSKGKNLTQNVMLEAGDVVVVP